ncbi:50S ribosomal protein L10, partial [Candidatus Woesearchaeota archaeon]|nr:50S ribosomal protein L10 [Candidatus Woesearchaeota archaeon]
MEKEKKPHVSEYKKKTVDEFVKLIKEYPIIGALNMENLPAPQLQVMKGQLRDTVVMRMTKRRLLKIAIEKVKAEKKGIEEIEKYLKGMPALLFSKENPFKLYKTLKKRKSSAPAKAGQTAPKDILVPAGPTNFAPGPVIGELGAMGIKTSVEGGKIAIKEDTVIVKEGEEIKANVAGMLTRLGIEPMEIGLDLVAVYEDGTIYTKDILDVDEEQLLAQLQDAHRWSFNLAVEAGYFTKDTIDLLVPKAFNEAKALALEANIMADAVAEELIAKAEAQGKSLKEEIKYEDKVGKTEEKSAEAPKEEKKEEPKVEEKKEEVKEEKKEEPKPEPKVEEKKEEPKPEIQKEEPKVEEKKEEPKKEEPKPKVKEKPVEVPKEEEKKEEAKAEPEPVPQPEPKVEEKKEEPKPEPKVEEKKEEPKVEAPKEEKKPEPEKKEAKEDVKTRAEELKEKLEKAREIKKEIEEKNEVKVEEKSRTSDIIRVKKEEGSEVLEKKKQDIETAENLFHQLQKKGTLRGMQETKKVKSEILNEPLSP